MLKKIFLWSALVLFLGLGAIFVVVFTLGRPPVPQGQEGSAAEALCRKIEQAVRLDRWKKTTALSFVFNDTHHFRDNSRGYREVSWESGGEHYRVQYSQNGDHIVYYNGKHLKAAPQKAYAAYQEAYKRHTNDFFWLNPFSQLRAPGTKRFYVHERALLVQYISGGATPGDSYLIITDAQGLPIRWQMWVSILPIKGVEFSFEDWQTALSGARFSLLHRSLLFDLRIRKLKTYLHYPDPAQGESDRFAEFVSLAPVQASPVKSP